MINFVCIRFHQSRHAVSCSFRILWLVRTERFFHIIFSWSHIFIHLFTLFIQPLLPRTLSTCFTVCSNAACNVLVLLFYFICFQLFNFSQLFPSHLYVSGIHSSQFYRFSSSTRTFQSLHAPHRSPSLQLLFISLPAQPLTVPSEFPYMMSAHISLTFIITVPTVLFNLPYQLPNIPFRFNFNFLQSLYLFF